MARIRLKVEYDGRGYVGWQTQPNGPSIQAALEKALATLLGQPISVSASGRTDAGVHAKGQIVCFDSPKDLPLKAYFLGLNRLLPEDIAVVSADEVDGGFDPRRHALGKRYRYHIYNRRSRAPLHRAFSWLYFYPLNVDLMHASAQVLLGRHDFSAFRAADCEAKHAVREIFKLEVKGQTGGEITVTVEGTAFLKNMVRNVVGSLVEVGRGKQKSAWLGQVLASRDRTFAGPTAPAHGLVLEEVFYGSGLAPTSSLDD